MQKGASEVLKAFENVRAFLTTTIREHRDRFDPDDIQSFVDIYLQAEMEDEQKNTETGNETHVHQVLLVY